MKAARIAIALAVAFSLTVGSAGVALAGDKGPSKGPKKAPGKNKVKVCHIPSGNPANAHVIKIPYKAFKKGHKYKHGGKVWTKHGKKFVTDFLVESKWDYKECKNLGKKRHH